jgi:hypothetical protein
VSDELGVADALGDAGEVNPLGSAIEGAGEDGVHGTERRLD